ncbi:MAG: hypothetical protein LBU27_09185 [Candidatus Peribacteria bacterium]|jgi:hypothetical protein|nr:hypothetical protein [Candidatus Peribacteria bacterium]
MKLTKEQLKEKLHALIARTETQENSMDYYRSLSKKELKSLVNEFGGFTKGKINLSREPTEEIHKPIPEGAVGFEAILSDETINLNGYRILVSAREEGFRKYFSDYEGSVYYQHNMEQPIGKTLDMYVRDGYLGAIGYIYDDLTDHRVSRGLVRDISTGHIALEIKYINKDTNEEKTPSEFSELLWDMVDRLREEGKSRDEIWEAINQLRELRIETHTKVQIVEYSFVSVGANVNAEAKILSNLLEKNGLTDVELDREPNNPITTQDNVENAGETPAGGTDDTSSPTEEPSGNDEEAEGEEVQPQSSETPAENADGTDAQPATDEEAPENGTDAPGEDTPADEGQPTPTEENEIVNLKAELLTCKKELEQKEATILQLQKEIEEQKKVLEFLNAEKKKVKNVPLAPTTPLSAKSDEEVQYSLSHLMKRR